MPPHAVKQVTGVTEGTAPSYEACKRNPTRPAEVTRVTTESAISPYKVPPSVLPQPEVKERPCYATYDDYTTYGRPGLYFHGQKESRRGEIETFDYWLCGPIHAEALTYDEHGHGFGLLLRFLDARGRWKQWAMPMRLLSSDGRELRAELLDMGLRIDPKSHHRLGHWLASREPRKELIAATRTGWHALDDGHAFVMPQRVIGSEQIVFQHEQAYRSTYSSRGSVEDWRKAIGALCSGNPLMTLMVSAALAGPLLKLTHQQSAGLHVIGDSSSGKSTLLQVATSVWGPPEFMRTWRATGNGLEGVAAEHSDTCIVLDEISEADPREIGAIVYALGNGTGKSRAGRGGDARATARWRIVMLSSGERSVAAHMAEGGKRVKAGQEVRLLDMPADCQYGVFDALHDHKNGRAFSDHLKSVSGRYYGALGSAFIERLQQDKQDLTARLDMFRQRSGFKASHGLEHRAATSLALMALAGELATEYGLTGWPSGEALNASETAFQLWCDYRGSGQTETRQILDAVRDFIDRHGESRFSPIDAHESQPLVRDRAGWWRKVEDERVYMFTSGGLKEATQGYDFRRVLLALKTGKNLYRTGSDKVSVSTRTSEGIKKLYHLLLL